MLPVSQDQIANVAIPHRPAALRTRFPGELYHRISCKTEVLVGRFLEKHYNPVAIRAIEEKPEAVLGSSLWVSQRCSWVRVEEGDRALQARNNASPERTEK